MNVCGVALSEGRFVAIVLAVALMTCLVLLALLAEWLTERYERRERVFRTPPRAHVHRWFAPVGARVGTCACGAERVFEEGSSG